MGDGGGAQIKRTRVEKDKYIYTVSISVFMGSLIIQRLPVRVPQGLEIKPKTLRHPF